MTGTSIHNHPDDPSPSPTTETTTLSSKLIHPLIQTIQQGRIRRKKSFQYVTIALLAVLSATSPHLIVKVIQWTLTLIGQMLSIGLGLGLALHICHRLQLLSENVSSLIGLEDPAYHSMSNIADNGEFHPSNRNASSCAEGGVSAFHQDSNAAQTPFVSRRASYAAANISQRRPYTGRGTDEIKFTHPNIAEAIRDELGILSDLVMRDFVKVWYCKVDARCNYDSNDGSHLNQKADDACSSEFIVHLHRALAGVLGTLASVVGERANVCDLVLIQFIRTLSFQIQQYRRLHKYAVARVKKRYESKPTNMTDADFNKDPKNDKSYAVGMEYVLRGAAHPAMTYELLSEENVPLNSNEYQRLLADGGKKMHNCELNYLRHISKHLCKFVLPDDEWNSKIVRSLSVEVLAGCVLLPVLNLIAIPSSLNYLIVGQEALNDNKISSEGAMENESTLATMDDRKSSDLTSNSPNKISASASTDTHSKAQTSPHIDDVVAQSSSVVRSEPIHSTDDTTSTSSFLDSITHEPSTVADVLLPNLTLAVIEVQNILFTESTLSNGAATQWDTSECRHSVSQLVLAIEAALLHGRSSSASHKSLEDVLMLLTEDLDAFELLEDISNITSSNANRNAANFDSSSNDAADFSSNQVEDMTTLRTLIATWLQTGMVYQILTMFHAQMPVLRPLYNYDAFFASREEEALFFVSQLKILDGVEVLVDTMALLHAEAQQLTSSNVAAGTLACPSSSSSSKGSTKTNIKQSGLTLSSSIPPNSKSSLHIGMPSSRNIKRWWVNNASGSGTTSSKALLQALQSSLPNNSKTKKVEYGKPMRSAEIRVTSPTASANPVRNATVHKKINYRTNTEVTARLRMERERRNFALASSMEEYTLSLMNTVHHKPSKVHRAADALHGTLYSIDVTSSLDGSGVIESQLSSPVALLESTGTRRLIEIPHEDPRFFATLSPRPIQPIGEHRSLRSGADNYRSYAATYRLTNKKGGIFIKRCLLRFYYGSHMCSLDDPRWTNDDVTSSGLNKQFKKQRYKARKILFDGNHSGSQIRSSSLLSAAKLLTLSDIEATPRVGKSMEFLYRKKLFVPPQITVNGIAFEIRDATQIAPCVRVDGSHEDVSDACLTGKGVLEVNLNNSKLSTSELRAILLIKEARSEAQRQCLAKAIDQNAVKKLNEHSSKVYLFQQPSFYLLKRKKFEAKLVALDYLQRKGIHRPYNPMTVRAAVVDTIQYASSNDLLLNTTNVEYKVKVTRTIGTKEQQWTLHKKFTDFLNLYKHLKTQVNDDKRLVPSFLSLGTHSSQTFNSVLPVLNVQSKVPGTSSKKFIQRRVDDLNAWLHDLFDSKTLKGCDELNKFLIAWETIDVGDDGRTNDAYGRMNVREIVRNSTNEIVQQQRSRETRMTMVLTGSTKFEESHTAVIQSNSAHQAGSNINHSSSSINKNNPKISTSRTDTFQSSIEARISSVRLQEFQSNMYSLIKNLFHLDNKTILARGAIGAAYRMLFVLTGTTSTQFTRNLTKWHSQLINTKTISGWIRSIHNSLWPNGIWFKSSPPFTDDQCVVLEERSMAYFMQLMPEQAKVVLGENMVDDGIELLHEMLQNEIVLKTLVYQLMDLLLIEIFPELKDYLHHFRSNSTVISSSTLNRDSVVGGGREYDGGRITAASTL